MVTNDERRRVVSELREMSAWDDEVDCTDFGKRVANLLVRNLGCGGTEGVFYAALADLIDSAENVRYIATVKVEGEKLEELAKEVAAEYARIDREALADIAREMDRLALHCFRGDLHVPPAAVCDFAYRIRKAIREVPDGNE